MNKPLLAQLVLIFLIAQGLGLWAGNYLIAQNVSVTIVNEDKNSIDNSIGLFIWILAMTIVLLALIKFAPDWLFYWIVKTIESLAVFSTAIIVLAPTEAEGLAVYGLALLLVLLRVAFSGNVVLRNVSSVVATAGAGALIGASLGVLPILAFLILVSIYDFIAVFRTKHMVKLAKGITGKNFSFTFALPTKEHQFELGTGDIVVPMMFAVSLLAAAKQAFAFPYFAIPPLVILAASLAGLLITMDYASKHKGTALPALPLQAAFMLVAFAALKLGGF